MKKNTKKKVFTLMLVIMLLSIAIVGGSLAWFTDEDQATNTFTVGSVVIKQHEDFDKESAKLLIPAVGTFPSKTNNYIKKTVTVENTGENSAFVQTLVAVPASLDEAGILKLWDDNYSKNEWTKLDGNTASDGIQPYFSNIEITGEEIPYNVYVYRYNTPLAVNSTTGACLEWVYIDSHADMEVTVDQYGNATSGYFTIKDDVTGETIKVDNFNAITDELNIYVLTQAVQSQGFTKAEYAFNEAFGTSTPDFTKQ